MELRHIRYFLALARHRNFTRAADELHIVQPALSQQIKKLEQELDLPLFIRGSSGVSLTPAGEAFLPRAQRILAEVDDAVLTLRRLRADTDSAKVNFGVMHTLSAWPVDVPSLLSEFNRRHPQVQVTMLEGNAEELVTLLRQGKLDVAIVDVTLLPPLEPLQVQVLGTSPLVAIVGATHRMADRNSVKLEELADEPFLKLASGSAIRLNAIIKACRAAGHEPKFLLSAASVPMARSLVSSGVGIYITYRWAAEAPGPAVKTLELTDAPLSSELALVWRSDIDASAAELLQMAKASAL